MAVEVKVPTVGESIREGLLAEWLRQDGEAVAVDQPLFVLETDKITLTVNAESAGMLRVGVAAGETVQIGQVVARIEPGAVGTVAAAPAAAAPLPLVKAAIPAAPPPVASAALNDLSPAVRRLVVENKLDPTTLAGSGPHGRVLKEDVLGRLEQPPGKATAELAPVVAAPSMPTTSGRETRTKQTPLRKRLAERLVQAQHAAAMLTTFNEVDMSAVIELRNRHQEAFKAQHGVGLGFMSFFVKAAVGALKAVPAVNARLDGDEIVHHQYFDIGIAVSSPRGLVVPVVRNCDQLALSDIEHAIEDFATRARTGGLKLDELQGGVFTISNGGVFGSLLSTPILNPPQCGILGMHAIKKRPVVVDDQIAIRPMMYLAMSYDHRLVDGAEAVTFLKSIVDCLEKPERILLEVCGGKL